jgi:hypothetical protein
MHGAHFDLSQRNLVPRLFPKKREEPGNEVGASDPMQVSGLLHERRIGTKKVENISTFYYPSSNVAGSIGTKNFY